MITCALFFIQKINKIYLIKERGTIMSNEKTTSTNEKIANLNQVEGFNPENYARIISDDGENARKYLDVVWRKVWFYLKYPNGRVTKRIVQMTTTFVIVEARVYFDRNDAEENYVSSAMAQRWFKKDDKFGERAVETAETGAVGRALADAGFGLQYCCDIHGDGEQDIVDAPIEKQTAKPQGNTTAQDVKQPEAPPKPAASPAENPQSKAPGSTTGKKAGDEAGNTPAAVQPKLNAPVGLLVNTANTAAGNTAPAGNEIPEETSGDFEEIKTGGTDIPHDEEIIEEPENNQEGKQQAEEPAPQEYNNSMEVNEIIKVMSFEDAMLFTIDVGINKGKTIAYIAEHNPKGLKWYFTSYSGTNNCLRAAAKIVDDYVEKMNYKAA
jgi:hypothetical protein